MSLYLWQIEVQLFSYCGELTDIPFCICTLQFKSAGVLKCRILCPHLLSTRLANSFEEADYRKTRHLPRVIWSRFVRFRILTGDKLKITVKCGVALYSCADTYQRFGRTCCLKSAIATMKRSLILAEGCLCKSVLCLSHYFFNLLVLCGLFCQNFHLFSNQTV